jgi:D-beta-D-heptose 7-phosphate kinase/D-beta-D-heptose 1-phosphate adenosyltransferase
MKKIKTIKRGKVVVKKKTGKAKKKSHTFLNSGSNLKQRFIADYGELRRIVGELRKNGLSIVLTQGVYDLIHEGHAAYLENAKSYGDILIVGVDSDELTRKRKGPRRPIVPQEERLKMLVHLRHVDIVTLKEEHQSLGELIQTVRPDVMVFSQSTKDITKEMVDAYGDYCGKIVVLPPQATTSTTARVRNLTIEGAEKLAEEINTLIKNYLDTIRNSQ